MNSFHLALITFDFYPSIGGQGRNFHEMYRKLRREFPQIKISVVSACPPLDEHCHTFLGWTRKIPHGHLLFSFLMYFRWRRLFRRIKPDVVLINAGPGGLFVFPKIEAKQVLYVNHTYAQSARLVPGDSWKACLTQIEKHHFSQADFLFVNSNSTRESLRSDYNISHERIEVFPCLVDVEHFRPLHLEREPYSLLFVGRLERRKGLEQLLRALPEIKKRLPEVKLYVVGNGKLMPRLRSLCEELSIQEQVVFLGQVSHEELAQWYNRVAVTVVPSHYEGLGIVALESQACATPVVAANVPGLRDALQDTTTGYLYKPIDQRDLTERVVSLCSDATRLQSMAVAGRKFIEQNSSIHGLASQLSVLAVNH